MAPRAWQWWTEHKLSVLSDYLQAFTTASHKKAGQIVYLDLFAGEPHNVHRDYDRDVIGSARRALDVQPPFTVLRFFERPARAAALQQALAADHPGRDIRVYAGDCNDQLGQALADLRWLNWAPTFAFLDQEAAEVTWSSLQRLARHKRPGRSKVELWLLFATGMIPRGLQSSDGFVNERFADEVSDMFGTRQWQDILHGRQQELLDAARFRDELRNLMRWRLETELGYKWTQVLNVVNTSGTPLYDMIFATDHDAGHKIMHHVYTKAAREQPEMRQQARALRRQQRDEAQGITGLFDTAEVPAGPAQGQSSSLYEHHPPWEPYRLPEH